MSAPLSIEQVQNILTETLNASHVEVLDMTGTSDHFDVTIVSSMFQGESLIRQHQMVYRALGEAMHGPVHALKLQTRTPEQWEAEQS